MINIFNNPLLAVFSSNPIVRLSAMFGAFKGLTERWLEPSLFEKDMNDFNKEINNIFSAYTQFFNKG